MNKFMYIIEILKVKEKKKLVHYFSKIMDQENTFEPARGAGVISSMDWPGEKSMEAHGHWKW